MCGDDELRVIVNQMMNGRNAGELPIGWKGGFWFTQQIQAFSFKFVQGQSHEGFSMRAGMERLPSIACKVSHFVPVGGDVEKTFGAKEIAVLWFAKTFGEFQEGM